MWPPMNYIDKENGGVSWGRGIGVLMVVVCYVVVPDVYDLDAGGFVEY